MIWDFHWSYWISQWRTFIYIQKPLFYSSVLNVLLKKILYLPLERNIVASVYEWLQGKCLIFLYHTSRGLSSSGLFGILHHVMTCHTWGWFCTLACRRIMPCCHQVTTVGSNWLTRLYEMSQWMTCHCARLWTQM